MKKLIKSILVFSVLGFTIPLFAAGRLVIYCSNEGPACQIVADTFAKKYDVNVQMTRSGSGSVYAKILAEKSKPKGDVWYAGTLDPHSQAGVNGLLESYKSPMLSEIGEEFKDLFIDNGGTKLDLVPSLNSEKRWVKAISDLLQKQVID